jgi:hypothetical protein
LPRAAVLQADPEAVTLVADLVRGLFDRGPRARCERHPEPADLRPEQVAVGVSHNDQEDHLRVAPAQRRLDGVIVQTANKLQGLQFEVVVAWHPLSGLPEADGFHLDLGRLCVLLTRHRQACIVVARPGATPLVPQKVTLPEKKEPTGLSWQGEVPTQKWMNFYTKVLSKLASGKGLRLTVRFELTGEGAVSQQKIEETRGALRELGLDDGVSTSRVVACRGSGSKVAARTSARAGSAILPRGERTCGRRFSLEAAKGGCQVSRRDTSGRERGKRYRTSGDRRRGHRRDYPAAPDTTTCKSLVEAVRRPLQPP